ncbi:hypothetical protein PUN28_001957 [Cardiocondyla obscurior]|uniref:Uncharacterized protein n=1 Tax=Cardiocondyla obscurior TaxID=286306 RepID=A0AAW2GS49_9HYME
MDPVGRSPLIAGEYALYWHRLTLYCILHSHHDRITLSRRHSRTHSLEAGVIPVCIPHGSLRVRDICDRCTCVIYIYIYRCMQTLISRMMRVRSSVFSHDSAPIAIT